MIEYFQVKDFERFQHYKDRDPPWIKLYVRLLEDYTFAKLTDAQKFHIIGCWILASKMENKLPKDAKFITDKICAEHPVDLEALLASGFLQPWVAETARGKRELWASRHVSAQLRTALLSAAQHRCSDCSATDGLEIDHITPISRGGTGDQGNLQVLCRKCNRTKRAKIRAEDAETLRRPLLRRGTDPRSPETETEAEAKTEQATTTSASRSTEEVTDGQIMAAIRDHLYLPDGKPPDGWEESREFSIMRQLRKHGKSGAQIRCVVEGLGVLAREGSVKWLKGKTTLRAVFNSQTGCLDMWGQAEDAYYRAPPEARRKKGSATGIEQILASIAPRAN